MKYLFLSIVLICTLLACQNDDNNEILTCETEGKLLGYDFALCACCGGAYLEMNEDTFYVLDMPMLDSPLDSFPLPVKFDWEIATGTCADIQPNAINLTCLEEL